MSEQPINQWNMTTEPSDMTMILSAMTVIKLYVANSSLIFTNLRLRLITTRYL